MKKCIWGLLVLGMLTACSDKVENTEKEGVETVLPSQVNEVTVMKLVKRDFNHELVSNGKLTAKEYADLYFRSAEVVGQVWVKNGTRVRKGQKLAELDLFKLNNMLLQSKNSLAQASLEMQDVLIGQGYAPDKTEGIPADVMELAKVKSGYEQAKAQYEAAQYELSQATLTAPFDGIVANLFEKTHNLANTAEPFCRIISTASMEVDFTVLESELPLIKVGDKVEVTPYASPVGVRTGSISEINPLVDSYIIDSAPFKQGRFAPASHLPIVAPDYFFEHPVDVIMIVAPGYSDEIAGVIRTRFGADVRILTLRSERIEEL